jgi:hypothetical protein
MAAPSHPIVLQENGGRKQKEPTVGEKQEYTTTQIPHYCAAENIRGCCSELNSLLHPTPSGKTPFGKHTYLYAASNENVDA